MLSEADDRWGKIQEILYEAAKRDSDIDNLTERVFSLFSSDGSEVAEGPLNRMVGATVGADGFEVRCESCKGSGVYVDTWTGEEFDPCPTCKGTPNGKNER